MERTVRFLRPLPLRWASLGEGFREAILQILPGYLSHIVPAGCCARDLRQVAVHTGPYDVLVPATDALLAWAEKNGIVWQTSTIDNAEWWTGRIESYPIDPGGGTRPAEMAN